MWFLLYQMILHILSFTCRAIEPISTHTYVGDANVEMQQFDKHRYHFHNLQQFFEFYNLQLSFTIHYYLQSSNLMSIKTTQCSTLSFDHVNCFKLTFL